MRIKKLLNSVILPKYDIGSFKKLETINTGFANKNYKLTTENVVALCRIVKQKEEADLAFEIRFLNYLKSHDFPTAYPIARKDESYINREDGELIVLTEFLDGHEPVPNHQTVRQIGHSVGTLGSLPTLESLQRKNDLTIHKCRQLADNLDGSSIPNRIKFYFKSETNLLEPILNNSLPTGYVHGDIFTDNTIFKDSDLIGIIDFEEVSVDQLLFDVGTTIQGFCYVDNDLNPELLQLFLKSYHAKRSLNSIEQELLPWYIRWGAHAQIFWHLQYGLLQRYNRQQLERVEQLIDRVEWARENMNVLSRTVNQCFQ